MSAAGAGAGAGAAPAPAPAAAPTRDILTKIDALKAQIDTIATNLAEAKIKMEEIVPDIKDFSGSSPISYLLNKINTGDYIRKLGEELGAIKAFLEKPENGSITTVPYKTYATTRKRRMLGVFGGGGRRKYTLRRI